MAKTLDKKAGAYVSRAPRRVAQRPALCRIRNSCQCWATRVQDYSLSGALLTGFPPAGPPAAGNEIELIEGLENQIIKDFAPVLLSGRIEEIDKYIKKITRANEFRHSFGKVARINSQKREFGVAFDKITYEERFYPRAQQLAPQLRGIFHFEGGKGRMKCRGKFTPGAAIDLAKDIISDVRQCMLMVDLAVVRDYSRIAAEKFCTRLLGELTEQDISTSLALVVPEEWPEEHFQKIRLFKTQEEALEALTMPVYEGQKQKGDGQNSSESTEAVTDEKSETTDDAAEEEPTTEANSPA